VIASFYGAMLKCVAVASAHGTEGRRHDKILGTMYIVSTSNHKNTHVEWNKVFT